MSRWVLITGARRLGASVARLAGARGWNVALHFRSIDADAEALAQYIRATGRDAALLQGDFADPAAASVLVERAATFAKAPVTALVNCAAVFEHDMLQSLTHEALMRHFVINAATPIVLTQALAAQLGDAHGAVVNFLDYKLAQPYEDHFSYTISKYALAGATELLARTLAPRVRVNAVAPAYAVPSPGQSQQDFGRLHDDTPLGRGVTPEGVAEAALYLLEAPAVTGQTIYVDAGQRFTPRDRDFAFS